MVRRRKNVDPFSVIGAVGIVRDIVANPRNIFHVTFTSKVPSIKKKGLLPFQTTNWIKSGDKSRYGEGQIFAFESFDDALRWAGKMDWEFHKGLGTGKISILQLEKDGDWEVDDADPISQLGGKGKWLKRYKSVPTSKIHDSLPLTPALLRNLKNPGKRKKNSPLFLEMLEEWRKTRDALAWLPDPTTPKYRRLKKRFEVLDENVRQMGFVPEEEMVTTNPPPYKKGYPGPFDTRTDARDRIAKPERLSSKKFDFLIQKPMFPADLRKDTGSGAITLPTLYVPPDQYDRPWRDSSIRELDRLIQAGQFTLPTGGSKGSSWAQHRALISKAEEQIFRGHPKQEMLFLPTDSETKDYVMLMATLSNRPPTEVSQTIPWIKKYRPLFFTKREKSLYKSGGRRFDIPKKANPEKYDLSAAEIKSLKKVVKEMARIEGRKPWPNEWKSFAARPVAARKWIAQFAQGSPYEGDAPVCVCGHGADQHEEPESRIGKSFYPGWHLPGQCDKLIETPRGMHSCGCRKFQDVDPLSNPPRKEADMRLMKKNPKSGKYLLTAYGKPKKRSRHERIMGGIRGRHFPDIPVLAQKEVDYNTIAKLIYPDRLGSGIQDTAEGIFFFLRPGEIDKVGWEEIRKSSKKSPRKKNPGFPQIYNLSDLQGNLHKVTVDWDRETNRFFSFISKRGKVIGVGNGADPESAAADVMEKIGSPWSMTSKNPPQKRVKNPLLQTIGLGMNPPRKVEKVTGKKLSSMYKSHLFPHSEARLIASELSFDDPNWDYEVEKYDPTFSLIRIFDKDGKFAALWSKNPPKKMRPGRKRTRKPAKKIRAKRKSEDELLYHPSQLDPARNPYKRRKVTGKHLSSMYKSHLFPHKEARKLAAALEGDDPGWNFEVIKYDPNFSFINVTDTKGKFATMWSKNPRKKIYSISDGENFMVGVFQDLRTARRWQKDYGKPGQEIYECKLGKQVFRHFGYPLYGGELEFVPYRNPRLTAAQRRRIPSSEFGLPKSRKYPMPDRSHAISAKGRATQMLNEGYITRDQWKRITAKADRVLGKEVPSRLRAVANPTLTRMTMPEVRDLYASTDITMEEIADQTGIDMQTLVDHLRETRKGWGEIAGRIHRGKKSYLNPGMRLPDDLHSTLIDIMEWKGNWAAKPYAEGLLNYAPWMGESGDNPRSILLYLKGNIGTWRGDKARAGKKVINKYLKEGSSLSMLGNPPSKKKGSQTLNGRNKRLVEMFVDKFHLSVPIEEIIPKMRKKIDRPGTPRWMINAAVRHAKNHRKKSMDIYGLFQNPQRKNPKNVSIPFSPGQKIPVGEARKWLVKNGDRSQLKQFDDALKLQTKANRKPKFVQWQELSIGSPDKIDAISSFVHYGTQPESVYQAPQGSKKGQDMYVHEWGEDNPNGKPVPVLVSSDGKNIVSPVGDGQTIDDWMRG